jgi:hypothetical protein
MKRLLLTVVVVSVLVPASLRAAEAIEDTFKRALFEEEGNRNYAAAVPAYEEVVRAIDDQRRLAATAVFRLGECYRKLGRPTKR